MPSELLLISINTTRKAITPTSEWNNEAETIIRVKHVIFSNRP
jgi:hypothetical protein